MCKYYARNLKKFKLKLSLGNLVKITYAKTIQDLEEMDLFKGKSAVIFDTIDLIHIII